MTTVGTDKTSDHRSAPPLGDRPALILAGGGMKVAFQAGVLQVWLDEAEIPFMLADGTSGGTFNLAMYCQGMTGRQIADNWRGFRPRTGISLNWRTLPRGPFASSIFTFDRYRRRVFPSWGLDWSRIAKPARRPASTSTTSPRMSWWRARPWTWTRTSLSPATRYLLGFHRCTRTAAAILTRSM